MRLHRLASTALCAALAFGCASAKLTVIDPLPRPEGRVSLAVEYARRAPISDVQQSSFRTILTNRLTESGVTVVSSDTPEVHAVRGDVQRYDQGDRFVRWLIGFVGAGRGKLESSWSVVDDAGDRIGACRIDGSIAMGVFGGHFDRVLEKVGDRIGEFLKGERE